MLNSHVRPTRLHEEFFVQWTVDWAFGDNKDDLNEALLQASDEFESQIIPRATAPSCGLHFRPLHLQQAPPATNQTHFFLL